MAKYLTGRNRMNTESRIRVMGSGCPSCRKLHRRVLNTAASLGLEGNVDYVTDMEEIIKLGVISTPVFAVDDTVISAGRIPSEPEIKETLNALLKEG